jgi:ABC-type transport system involved in cytochrome c biogenesis permease subunit
MDALSILRSVIAASLLVSALLDAISAMRARRVIGISIVLDAIALFLLGFYLVSVSVSAGFPAVASFGGAISLYSLFMMLIAVSMGIADPRPEIRAFTSGLKILSGLFIGITLLPGLPQMTAQLNPILKSVWLVLHISAAVAGEAFFSASFVCALLWFFSRASSGRETLAKNAFGFALAGFSVYSVGALVFGMIWASEAWGAAWSWDPKETWALVTWLCYAVCLHLPRTKAPEPLKMIALISSFSVAMFAFIGVNVLLRGLHSY